MCSWLKFKQRKSSQIQFKLPYNLRLSVWIIIQFIGKLLEVT